MHIIKKIIKWFFIIDFSIVAAVSIIMSITFFTDPNELFRSPIAGIIILGVGLLFGFFVYKLYNWKIEPKKSSGESISKATPKQSSNIPPQDNKTINKIENTDLNTNNALCEQIKADEPRNAYITKGNITHRVDGKAIEKSEVPYLIQAGLDRALKEEAFIEQEKIKHITKGKNITPEKAKRLINNFELNHFDKYSKYEDALLLSPITCFSFDNFNDYVDAIEKYNASYIKLRKYCYSKGLGGEFYFDKNWLNDSEVINCINELNRIETNRHQAENEFIENQNQIKEREEKRKFNKKRREFIADFPDLLRELLENEESILQTDLYLKFQPDYKTSIAKKLKDLEKENLIIREKTGNTYIIKLNV